MITTVTPNPSVDWTLEIPSLTRGMVHRIVAQHEEPSGKGTKAVTLPRPGHADLAGVLKYDHDDVRNSLAVRV